MCHLSTTLYETKSAFWLNVIQILKQIDSQRHKMMQTKDAIYGIKVETNLCNENILTHQNTL